MQKIYDFIIIGSGFGGSASAMRLTEKGYSVLVIEQGKRFHPKDYPKTNWNLFKYLWVPGIRMFGIQKLSFYREASILTGIGVGGGSLVYAKLEVHEYKGLYIIDGSIIQANPGVNPSYSILAMAEYAMDQIPVKETGITQADLLVDSVI